MAYNNLTETLLYKTGRKGVVLEVLDEVYPNLFDFNRFIDNSVFKKYSKFKFTLVDSRKTKGTGNAVYYNLGTDEIVLLCYLLSDGNPESFKKRVGAFNSMSQAQQVATRSMVETFDKIDISRFDRMMDYSSGKLGSSITFQKNINTDGDNLLIRRFTLSYEDGMNSASKWKIGIEEGVGKKDINKGNGLNIVKSGSFKSTAKSFLNLQPEEVVIPISEAASRVVAAKQSFYPIMKMAEVDFTKRKMEAKDYEGKKIDEWNPQGKSTFVPKVETETTEDKKTIQEDNKKDQSKAKEISDEKKLQCSECNVGITENIYNYSTKQFKKPLCFNCQKKEKENK